MSEAGRFAGEIANWRRLMATVPADARVAVFTNAASEIASYVPKGLDKRAAVDELADIASAHGLDDTDTVQQIIADAFVEIEQLRFDAGGFNEVQLPPADKRANGKGREAPAPRVQIQSQQQFIQGFVPPDYLVDGILQRRFVYSLTGPTGHAKTAIALLLAELIASGNPSNTLGAHKIEAGRVLYFVGENPDDVRMRLIGSHSRRDDDPTNDKLFFIVGTFNIGQMFRAVYTEISKIGPFDLVIIDTSAAYFLGQDENANPQIGAHARMLRSLTTLPGGPTVLVLCHPIKHAATPEQLLPRGGGAFLAEVDGNLTIWKHYDDLVELHYTKLRGPGFEPIPFKLETIRTGRLTDVKNREIPTVRAQVISLADEDRQRSRTRDDDDRVMAQMLKAPDASIAAIAEACGWSYGNGEPAKSRVNRAIHRLEKKAHPPLVRRDRDQALLTEEGKKVARIASIRLVAEAERQNQASLI